LAAGDSPLSGLLAAPILGWGRRSLIRYLHSPFFLSA
jgi:hypothetical protein